MMSNEPKIVLDIRSEEEYITGHIPGSKNIGLQELSYALSDVELDDKILIVCRMGKRAAQVKVLLEEEGYQQVEILVGGMEAYKGEIEQGE